MAPPAPPFPVPRNFPFHAPSGGSHTSILMCDSGVGASVAATRQNAGVFMAGAFALAPGAWNAPASTDATVVIAASCSFSALSASHPDAGAACNVNGRAAPAAAIAHAIPRPLTDRPLIADLPSG